MIKVDLSKITGTVKPESLKELEPRLISALHALGSKTGKGSDYVGWFSLPGDYDRGEFERVKAAAEKMRGCDVLVVIGIGGSYLGARAVIEFLCSPNYNLLKKDTPEIYFAGNNLSARHMDEIISIIGERDFMINVISKSGTTTEPAIAFRIFKALAEKKYGADAKNRIFATTDKARGALKSLADSEGYECFVIPDDVGGRYSVLTPVGLLPIAAAGINIDKLMSGALHAMKATTKLDFDKNPAFQYAAARYALYNADKSVELLACFEPSFRFMTEWWKQLYGESEGKGGQGIFPASVEFTADLHSMGQYIQDGKRFLFETVVSIESESGKMTVPEDASDLDKLNFLSGRSLYDINRQAARGTALAHVDGGVPNIEIKMPALTPFDLGWLIYFFEISCGLSGYLLDVNPFDQPGVESYKNNMFALLGKPGYEQLKSELESRLN